MTLIYPALVDKVVREVRFNSDPEFTAIVLEFTDNTEVSFRLVARIDMRLAPEIAIIKGGNIVGWKKLRAHRKPRKEA